MTFQLQDLQKYFQARLSRFVSLFALTILLAGVVCSCSRSIPLSLATSAAQFTPAMAPTASSTLPQPVPTLPAATAIPTQLQTSPVVFTNPFAALKSGQYLVYEAYPGSLIRDKRILGVVSLNGSQTVEQSLPPAWIDSDLNFSPDRKHISLSRYQEQGMSDTLFGSLLTVNLDQGQMQRLMTGMSCAGGSWSPDGTQLVATCGTEIYLFTPALDEKVPLTTNCLGDCSSVEWSPDGKWLSFVMGNQASPQSGLYLLSTACFNQAAPCLSQMRGPLNPLFSFPGPAWSPDGKVLVTFDRNWQNDELVKLEFIDVQTGLVQRTIEIPNTQQSWLEIHSLVWSPDGKWIAYNLWNGIYCIPAAGGAAPVKISDKQDAIILQWLNIP
jgi:Tol biopolymer transport system component